jgi:topoisomerase IA-like protein
MARTRKQGGSVRQLKSGRWGAYVLTDQHVRQSVEKGKTYPDKVTAQQALNRARARVELGMREQGATPSRPQRMPSLSE